MNWEVNLNEINSAPNCVAEPLEELSVCATYAVITNVFMWYLCN